MIEKFQIDFDTIAQVENVTIVLNEIIDKVNELDAKINSTKE
jgi:hypothetical protein